MNGPGVKAGEVVLGCAHFGDPDVTVYYYDIGGESVEESTGELFTFHWIAACHRCILAADGDPTEVPLKRKGVATADIEFENPIGRN